MAGSPTSQAGPGESPAFDPQVPPPTPGLQRQRLARTTGDTGSLGFAFPVQQPMFPEWGRLGGFPRGQRPGSRRQGGVPAERRAGLAGRPSVGRLAAACGRSGGCGGGGGGGGGGAARGAGGSHVKRTRRADGAPPCPLRCALWPGRARCCRHSAPTWAP